MYNKTECVAMLLAGGQGSRLYTLTEKTAKPAVPFGSKYRIIDFPLSNCVNSGIETVGVLTQYQPLVLNEYIGNGQPWDLDRMNGGVMVLPPYQGSKKADWYKGTANAIYQNLNFINRYDPDYVIILSGDHIYKMDYDAMLQYHKQKGAAATIAVLNVPLDQASRFGIMNTEPDGHIYEFEEKPKQPKSTKASMGVYVFNRKELEKYLTEDENDPESSNDFGKNIIPAMLANGEKLYAYDFSGYWKDVGTVKSLWEANMDLLGKNPAFDLFDSKWKIFSRSEVRPPHFIADGGEVTDSLITEGCLIEGKVEHSVLFGGVKIEKGAYVRNSIIMQDTVVKSGARVYCSIVDGNTVIGENAEIGERYEDNGAITLIGCDIEIPESSKIKAGEMVNADYLNKNKGN